MLRQRFKCSKKEASFAITRSILPLRGVDAAFLRLKKIVSWRVVKIAARKTQPKAERHRNASSLISVAKTFCFKTTEMWTVPVSYNTRRAIISRWASPRDRARVISRETTRRKPVRLVFDGHELSGTARRSNLLFRDGPPFRIKEAANPSCQINCSVHLPPPGAPSGGVDRPPKIEPCRPH